MLRAHCMRFLLRLHAAYGTFYFPAAITTYYRSAVAFAFSLPFYCCIFAVPRYDLPAIPYAFLLIGAPAHLQYRSCRVLSTTYVPTFAHHRTHCVHTTTYITPLRVPLVLPRTFVRFARTPALPTFYTILPATTAVTFSTFAFIYIYTPLCSFYHHAYRFTYTLPTNHVSLPPPHHRLFTRTHCTPAHRARRFVAIFVFTACISVKFWVCSAIAHAFTRSLPVMVSSGFACLPHFLFALPGAFC